ncbi:MAG TPA: GAF domain-containing protein [Steroidobacteraceae bacterium]
MHALHDVRHMPKDELYAELEASLRALLAGETDLIASAANMSALLYWSLPDLNWVGFYLVDAASGDLLVGPFQGKPACVRIPLGRGVCGTAAAERRTVLVQDVHQFPGHIACDSASNSEVVVPVIAEGRLLGVLDLDSPLPGRFDAADAKGLEALVEVFVQKTKRGDRS